MIQILNTIDFFPISAVKFGRMSKKQREKVEDEVRYHKEINNHQQQQQQQHLLGTNSSATSTSSTSSLSRHPASGSSPDTTGGSVFEPTSTDHLFPYNNSGEYTPNSYTFPSLPPQTAPPPPQPTGVTHPTTPTAPGPSSHHPPIAAMPNNMSSTGSSSSTTTTTTTSSSTSSSSIGANGGSGTSPNNEWNDFVDSTTSPFEPRPHPQQQQQDNNSLGNINTSEHNSVNINTGNYYYKILNIPSFASFGCISKVTRRNNIFWDKAKCAWNKISFLRKTLINNT